MGEWGHEIVGDVVEWWLFRLKVKFKPNPVGINLIFYLNMATSNETKTFSQCLHGNVFLKGVEAEVMEAEANTNCQQVWKHKPT